MSNNDSIEVSSSSVEQAVSEALQKLGAAEDDVVIEVLATPRSGVLGLGARDARVRVSRRTDAAATSGVTAPPPAPPPQRREQQPSQPRQEPSRPSREEPKAEAAPRQAEQRPPREPRPERQQQQRSRPPRREERAPEPQTRRPEADTEDLSAESAMDDDGDSNRHPANVEEQVKEASEILAQILERMGEKSEVRRGEGDRESLELDIKGDGSGILIGRHGQTLDALEYLLNRIVARRIKDAMPILLDTESYRARRRQQLHRMALSMGERAKREHEPMKLDPMPPRDRRIVHLALKDDPMLTTRSAGEGFLRSVEIVPVGGERESRGRGRENRRERPQERNQERPRERERERDRNSGQPGLGEQGGFKHGQKRLF